MPRHQMKRPMPQRHFLPSRMAGQIADDGVLPAADMIEGLRDRHRARHAFDSKSAVLRTDAAAPSSRATPGRFSARKLFSPVAGWLARWSSRRAEQRRLRQTMDHLSRAPNAVLRDIGVSKSEIAYRVRFAKRHDLD